MKKQTLLWSMGALLILASCSEHLKTESENKFKVISPLVMDTTIQNEYVADINALQNVEIRSRLKGFIEKINVDEGQKVSLGQVLFTISSKEYEQNLLRAKATTQSATADLKVAEIEWQNASSLLDNKIVSATEVDMLHSKVDAFKAKLAEAQADEAQAALQLSFTEIKAPFEGIINRIPNKVGSLVEEGTLLTVISNNKEVYAYFNVSEKEYLDYAASNQDGRQKEVSLQLANGAIYNQKGIIETTESEFDKGTGTIAFRAKFANPNSVLKHGSSGKIIVTADLKHAMLIPQKSTFEVQENIYVFVVDKNNTVQFRKVVPSVRLPQLYVITSGLSAQDKFIYEGIQRVKEGDKIVPENVLLSTLITSKMN